MLRRRCCFISEDSLPHPPPGLSLYLSLGTLLPWRSARSQFRILLLPIFRFFRLSPSSSFRPALPLSLAVGSVTLREPTAVRTFLFQTRLLFSLRLSHSLPLFLPYPPFSHPFFALSFSVHFLCCSSLTARLATLQRGPTILFLRSDSHRLSYHRLFAPTAPRMKARIYSYPMSSRIARHFCQISPRPVN